MRCFKMLTAAVVAAGLALSGCGAKTPTAPKAEEETAKYKDPTLPVTERVADLLPRMTLDEKIGQMTQVRWPALKSQADLAKYHIGSVLSGGDDEPSPNTPQAWADLHDRLQQAALGDRLGIPLLIGLDAVHGNSKLVGGTIFPHNIGLGAANNPALMTKVGQITAAEMLGVGANWNFAPCLAVVRNERWGRTYEGFGEATDLITTLTGPYVAGMKGILATAKHFIGDGATVGGQDQGDMTLSEAEWRSLLLPPYATAIKQGAGSVMVSFSSLNGQKAHGDAHLITAVLKGDLKFRGIVVSDWAGIDQIARDYSEAVRVSINAGIDVVMVPDKYQKFSETLKAEVKAGRVSEERINDAATRILTQKFELGLFEKPLADRTLLAQVGSAEHRAVAREAVRQSLVLLKNENSLLPLPKSGGKLYVAGKNADDIGNQMGGWSITWQGKSGNRTTGGTTILQAIKDAVAPGTTVTYDRRAATIDAGYRAAIVVVGETPYAEFKGDRPDALRLDAEDLQTIANVKKAGVPMAVVLISGRPLVITDQLPMMDALLAAWLPGTEGQGVADVLFGDYKPTGKLPHSWPRSEQQIPINAGDTNYDPLFAFGFGLTD
jgi:beta-glucosidase